MTENPEQPELKEEEKTVAAEVEVAADGAEEAPVSADAGNVADDAGEDVAIEAAEVEIEFVDKDGAVIDVAEDAGETPPGLVVDEAAPVDEVAAEETAVQETAAQETTAQETVAEETVAEETGAEEAPSENAPSDDVSVEETPVAEATVEDAIAEDVAIADPFTVQQQDDDSQAINPLTDDAPQAAVSGRGRRGRSPIKVVEEKAKPARIPCLPELFFDAVDNGVDAAEAFAGIRTAQMERETDIPADELQIGLDAAQTAFMDAMETGSSPEEAFVMAGDAAARVMASRGFGRAA